MPEPQYKCDTETKKPKVLLVHEPGKETRLAKEHPLDWGFDPLLAKDPRNFEQWREDAQKEHRTFVSALEQEDVKALYVTDLLQDRQPEVSSYLQQEFKRAEPKIDQIDPNLLNVAREAFEEGMASPASFLLLGLEAGRSFRQLPYEAKLQVYRRLRTLMPQTSLYYTQDGVISVPAGLVKARMSMWLRRQEPDVLQIALGGENYVYGLKNGTEGGDVTMCSYVHGGDVLYADGRMLLGITALSGRGIVQEAERLSQYSRVKDTVHIFVPDYFDPSKRYATENVMHLDTIMMPIDDHTLLANRRMLEQTVMKEGNRPLANGYQWSRKNFDRLVWVPDEEQQGTYGWGSNILPLGDDKILSSAHLGQINRNLRRAGFHVYEVESTTLTSGFGSFHCMTAYLL